ncbi:MAG: 2OG-Fe(II) oxygenase, partial [Pseudomonadota bacterium]|nr:2OG-Fe(II) oxygenase [Pseudomonadota bacterium]
MSDPDDTYRKALELNRQGLPAEAVSLFRAGAQEGHGPSCAAWAAILAHGQFVSQDLDAARAALETGFDGGDEACGLHLAAFRAAGYGGTASWGDAVALLINLANKQSAMAIRELGVLCALAGRDPPARMCIAHAASPERATPDAIAVALHLPALQSDPRFGAEAHTAEQLLARARIPRALLNRAPLSPDASPWDLVHVEQALQDFAPCPAELKALSADPPIAAAQRSVPPLVCDYLILSALPLLAPAQILDPTTGKSRRDVYRTGSTAVFSFMFTSPALVGIRELMCRAAGALPERGEHLSVIAYREGEEYRPHFDSFLAGPAADAADTTDIGAAGQRTHTALLNLNDAFEGGALTFPALGLTIPPQLGQLTVFANTTPDGERHPLSLHQGEPVKSGMKFIASQWIRAGRPSRHPAPGSVARANAEASLASTKQPDQAWYWTQFWRGKRVACCLGPSENQYDDEIRAVWTFAFKGMGQGVRMLDLCTGNGAVALMAAEFSAREGADFDIVGVDIAAIDPAAVLADTFPQAADIRFLGQTDIADLPFDNESFDAVVSQFGIEYADRSTAL